MAQIFYVHCPACGGRFPCHPELWDAPYDLLCPFCGNTFPQEASPEIITATGEHRAGREAGRPVSPRPTGAAAAPPEIDPNATAESM